MRAIGKGQQPVAAGAKGFAKGQRTLETYFKGATWPNPSDPSTCKGGHAAIVKAKDDTRQINSLEKEHHNQKQLALPNHSRLKAAMQPSQKPRVIRDREIAWKKKRHHGKELVLVHNHKDAHLVSRHLRLPQKVMVAPYNRELAAPLIAVLPWTLP